MPQRPSHPVLHTVVAATAFVVGYALARGLRPRHRAVRAEHSTDKTVGSPRGGRRWWMILRETYRRADENRLLAVAAGVVFYGLLAFVPGITALVSLYGLLADPRLINRHLSLLVDIVPADVIRVVDNELQWVSSRSGANLGAAFVASLVLALWSANGGMKAVIDALNVVNQHRETRGFVRLNATALGLTLGGLLAAIAAVGAVIALPLVMAVAGGGAGPTNAVLQLARWPALVLLILFGLSILYRFAPARPSPWRLFSPGAMVAAVLWLGGSALLSVYLGRFADYDATYGSLGAAIGLMMWMWMSSIVVLLGAELNSAIDAIGAGTEAGATRFAPTHR
jgi:membrane protein